MKKDKLAIFMFIFLNIFLISSCDKGETYLCDNAKSILGEIEIDNEKQLLIKASLKKDNTLKDRVPYEINFESIRSDCNVKDIFRFYLTTAKDKNLEGVFDVIPTNVYTINKSTSFTHIINTISPFSYKIQEATSMKVKITDNGNNEYKINIKGQELAGRNFEVDLKHRFEH